MDVIRVEDVLRGVIRLWLGSRKGCGCVDGGGCHAGLRVWSGRHHYRAVLGYTVEHCGCGQRTAGGL